MSSKHIIQLDGLRFFAVLMVMIAHWTQWEWTHPFLTNFPFVRGVTLFFVLSGFLITRILLTHRDRYDEQGLSKSSLIKSFYIRRLLRIFPVYYLLIIALFIANYDNTRELFPWLVTYTSNIYQSIHNVSIGEYSHFWSLAVEEQFYLFWPFVILFIKPKKTLAAIVLTIIISLVIKAILAIYVEHWMATSYFTLSCMHALGLGALLAYIRLYSPKLETRLSNPIYLYSSIALYIGLYLAHKQFNVFWYKEIFDDFFFALMSFFVILRASTNGFKGLAKLALENKFTSYSGKISYGMYVFHLFIPVLFFQHLGPKLNIYPESKLSAFLILFGITFFISHLSWKLIEDPISKLKSKVPYIKNV